MSRSKNVYPIECMSLQPALASKPILCTSNMITITINESDRLIVRIWETIQCFVFLSFIFLSFTLNQSLKLLVGWWVIDCLEALVSHRVGSMKSSWPENIKRGTSPGSRDGFARVTSRKICMPHLPTGCRLRPQLRFWKAWGKVGSFLLHLGDDMFAHILFRIGRRLSKKQVY